MRLTRKLPAGLELVGRRGSLLLLLFLAGCGSVNYVEIDNKKISVEIADNELERSKGLMFRESLCENCGMLFVYDENGERSFLMKNTLIPLKIIFIDENFIVTDVENAEPCKTDVCDNYNGYGKYVLEVNPEIEVMVGNKVKIVL